MILLLAVILTVEPTPATGCENGLARVQVSWREAGPGRVPVRVGSVPGNAVTGWEASEGSAETGIWVMDGMLFFLVIEQDQEIARSAAHVGGRRKFVLVEVANYSRFARIPISRV